MPAEIFQYRGEEIIAKLKKRRGDLATYAREYYEFLSKAVNIAGTDDKEWFDVKRISDQETRKKTKESERGMEGKGRG